MTKLLEWLTLVGMFTSAWLTLLAGKVVDVPPQFRMHVAFLPVYAIVLFGLGCLALLVYRTVTFNDCPEAAEELRKQIKEARVDLAAKGFKFNSAPNKKSD